MHVDMAQRAQRTKKKRAPGSTVGGNRSGRSGYGYCNHRAKLEVFGFPCIGRDREPSYFKNETPA